MIQPISLMNIYNFFKATRLLVLRDFPLPIRNYQSRQMSFRKRNETFDSRLFVSFSFPIFFPFLFSFFCFQLKSGALNRESEVWFLKTEIKANGNF